MGIDRRLGLAGLIVGLLGIGFTFLLPDAKWIGWLCIFVAALLLFLWARAELKQHVPRKAQYLVLSAIAFCIFFGVPGVLLWTSSHRPQPESASPLVPVKPAIKWDTPQSIAYGTPLSEKQLNASTPVEGVSSYNPDIGTVLPAGRHPLSLIFTPADTKKYMSVSQTVYLVVHPKSSKDRLQTTQATKTIVAGRPSLVITKLNGPSIPLTPEAKHLGFEVTLENRGGFFAHNAVLSGRVIFPNPGSGIMDIKEMKAECDRPTIYRASDGPSIGPSDSKTLNASADVDFEGIQNQIRDTTHIIFWGFLVGCVAYHGGPQDPPYHMGFTYAITSTLTPKQIRDLQGNVPKFLDKVYFQPFVNSPYDY